MDTPGRCKSIARGLHHRSQHDNAFLFCSLIFRSTDINKTILDQFARARGTRGICFSVNYCLAYLQLRKLRRNVDFGVSTFIGITG